MDEASWAGGGASKNIYMLDLLLFRSGDAPEDIRESQRRRRADVALVDEVISADTAWREQVKVAAVAKRAFTLAKAEGRPRSDKQCPEDSGRSKAELAALSSAASAASSSERNAHSQLQMKLLQIGNIVHEDAPMHEDDLSAPTPVPAPPPSLIRTAGVQRLVASGLGEMVPGNHGKWRPTAPAVDLLCEMRAYAMAFVKSRGYQALQAPVIPDRERHGKFQRMCKERGEERGSSSIDAFDNVIGALHACAVLQPCELPLRYAVTQMAVNSNDASVAVDGAAANGQSEIDSFVDGESEAENCVGAGPSIWLHVACADDGSCWEQLPELAQLAMELHSSLHGLPLRVHEVSAPRLKASEARAYALHAVASPQPSQGAASTDPTSAVAPAGGGELARASCEFDYRSRRLGIRCGFKALGERAKRHVHTLQLCLFRPSTTLLALAQAQAPSASYQS